MKVLTFLIALLLSAACCDRGPIIAVDDGLIVNPIISMGVFKPYVSLFEEQAHKYGVDIDLKYIVIRFNHLQSKDPKLVLLATCYLSNGFTPSIDVNPETWDMLSLVQRQILMFHELGHCILHKGHRIDKLSIMNPTLIDPVLFSMKERELMLDLFDPRTLHNIWNSEDNKGSNCEGVLLHE